jgi:hypothetical protein
MSNINELTINAIWVLIGIMVFTFYITQREDE